MSTDGHTAAPPANSQEPPRGRLHFNKWTWLVVALFLVTGTLLFGWVDPLDSDPPDTGPAVATLESIKPPPIYDPNSLESLFTLDHCPVWPDPTQFNELWADEGSLICLHADDPPDQATAGSWAFLAIQLRRNVNDEPSAPPSFIESFMSERANDRDGLIESSPTAGASTVHGRPMRHRCEAQVEGRDRACAVWWTDDEIEVMLLSNTDANSLHESLTRNLPTVVDLTARFDPTPHLPD